MCKSKSFVQSIRTNYQVKDTSHIPFQISTLNAISSASWKSCLQCRKVIRRKHQTFLCRPYIFRCETSLLARSLFSTEHSSLLLARDGVVGPKRADGRTDGRTDVRSESERHLCRVCRARRPSVRRPSPSPSPSSDSHARVVRPCGTASSRCSSKT